MSMVYRSEAGIPLQLTLALIFGKNRVYLVGRNQAPLWMVQRGPWKRPLCISWHRLEAIPGHWWMAQHGRELVILGQGARPALVVERTGTAWQTFLPAGHQSTAIRLPSSGLCQVRPVRASSHG